MTVQDHPLAAVPASPAGAAARPASFTGSWPTAAAWGAGLVQVALGAGALVSADSDLPARGAGAGLVGCGLALLGWGAAALSRGRILAPRLVLGVAVAAVLATFALLAISPAHTSVFAVAISTLLTMIVGAVCAVVVRRGVDRPRQTGGLRGILGLLAAAAVIATLVTPALGATQDAHLLQDDGTLPAVTHDH